MTYRREWKPGKPATALATGALLVGALAGSAACSAQAAASGGTVGDERSAARTETSDAEPFDAGEGDGDAVTSEVTITEDLGEVDARGFQVPAPGDKAACRAVAQALADRGSKVGDPYAAFEAGGGKWAFHVDAASTGVDLAPSLVRVVDARVGTEPGVVRGVRCILPVEWTAYPTDYTLRFNPALKNDSQTTIVNGKRASGFDVKGGLFRQWNELDESISYWFLLGWYVQPPGGNVSEMSVRRAASIPAEQRLVVAPPSSPATDLDAPALAVGVAPSGNPRDVRMWGLYGDRARASRNRLLFPFGEPRAEARAVDAVRGHASFSALVAWNPASHARVPCRPAIAMRERCDGVLNVHVGELVDGYLGRGMPLWIHVLWQKEPGRVTYRTSARIRADGELDSTITTVHDDWASLGVPSPDEIRAQ